MEDNTTLADRFIASATPDDLRGVVELVNSAYRGTGAQAGWTTEAAYIDGQRITLEDLTRDLSMEPRPTLLILRQSRDSEIQACAMVEPIAGADGEAKAYIGMVTVRPDLQAAGVGRVILEAAETHARAQGATRARMTVISIRESLIAWYQRRGYRPTGEEQPFPYHDPSIGTPRRPDLVFAVLEKPLTGADRFQGQASGTNAV
jgi:GNAT superfamily N-acetyltransferase